MVALTIVLAATVLLLVSQFGGTATESAPAVSWQLDDPQDRIVVVSAAQNADWSRLAVRVAACNQGDGSGAIGRLGTDPAPYQNRLADATGGPLNTAAATGTSCGPGTFVPISPNGAPMASDDFLAFCSSPASADMTDIKIEIQDTLANAVIHHATFLNWAAC